MQTQITSGNELQDLVPIAGFEQSSHKAIIAEDLSCEHHLTNTERVERLKQRWSETLPAIPCPHPSVVEWSLSCSDTAIDGMMQYLVVLTKQIVMTPRLAHRCWARLVIRDNRRAYYMNEARASRLQPKIPRLDGPSWWYADPLELSLTIH
jgi:hypothetical protein